MSDLATQELWSIFDARRVKAPELRGLDSAVNGVVGWGKNTKNRLRARPRLREQAERVGRLEPEIRKLGSAAFRNEVKELRDLARLNRLEGDALDRGMALAREAVWRAIEKRPFDVQMMGALAMYEGNVAEMAPGEGKTITAAVTASLWAMAGKPVHIITV